MSDLFLKIFIDDDQDVEIRGTPKSLEALGRALLMKADLQHNYECVLIGHGEQRIHLVVVKE